MAKKNVTLDEFHVTILVPQDLSEPEVQSVRRTLDSRRFQASLGRAVRRLFEEFPSLSWVNMKLSR